MKRRKSRSSKRGGWHGNSKGHSLAAKKGWRRRYVRQ